MLAFIRAIAGIGVVACACSVTLGAEPEKAKQKSREFWFTYHATVTGLKPGQTAQVWLPVPPSNDEQEVKKTVKLELLADATVGKEAKYGNQILFVEAKANEEGKIPLSVSYRIVRKEVRADLKAADAEKAAEHYLAADARVPVGGKSLTLIKGKTLPDDPVDAARVLYDAVCGHMRYSKEGTGWGRGDSDWACDSRYGNCSDFHSLFISLARAQKIPSRFEIGFPLPDKRGKGEIPGYHCWAWFKPEGHIWIPVDISEASKVPAMKEYYFGNLTENRIAFSNGRDLTLVPKQSGPALNFFIYPYVEVDGKPYADDKTKRRFEFEDVAAEKK